MEQTRDFDGNLGDLEEYGRAFRGAIIPIEPDFEFGNLTVYAKPTAQARFHARKKYNLQGDGSSIMTDLLFVPVKDGGHYGWIEVDVFVGEFCLLWNNRTIIEDIGEMTFNELRQEIEKFYLDTRSRFHQVLKEITL